MVEMLGKAGPGAKFHKLALSIASKSILPVLTDACSAAPKSFNIYLAYRRGRSHAGRKSHRPVYDSKEL